MSVPRYENQPTRAPDVDGHAKAWRIKSPSAPAWQNEGCAAAWLLHVPWAHPLWSFYVLQTIALRSIEAEDRPPVLQFPGASHEMLVSALNPDMPLADIDDWNGPGTPPMAYLEPFDQCVQFIVADDAQAELVSDLVVRAIVEGNLSPDSDFRGLWRETIANTAEHVRLGGHPDQ